MTKFKEKMMSTKPKETKKATQSMIDMIGQQLVAYTINKPADNKPISFVMCKEGVIEVRKTQVGQFARLHRRITEKEDSLIFKCMNVDPKQLESAAGIPPFRMALPRIPVTLLEQIIKFFKAVYKKQETEAAALIRWHLEKKEYYIEIPGGPTDKYQDLSGGGVKYKPDPKDPNPIVMDLHSHHTMSPFFSTTDDSDEQSTQLYAVIGHIDHSQEALNIRVRMNGTDLLTNVPVETIFEKDVTFNQEWMETIKKPPPEATKQEYTWPKERGWKRGNRRGRRSLRRGAVPGFPDDWESKLDSHSRESYGSNGGHGGYPEHPELVDEGTPTYAELTRGSGSEHTSDTPPEWQGLESPEIAAVFDEIWQVLENEFYDNPSVFCSQEAIKEARQFLTEQMANLSADEITTHACQDRGGDV